MEKLKFIISGLRNPNAVILTVEGIILCTFFFVVLVDGI
jgi:hypothetical protein